MTALQVGTVGTEDYLVWKNLASRARRSWGRDPSVPRTTSIANEAYLRLARVSALVQGNGSVSVALAALTMKRVLLDLQRRRSALKREAHSGAVSLAESPQPVEPSGLSIVEVQDALDVLRRRRPRQARVVELVLVGLSHREVARAIGLSERTVGDEWQAGRTWMRRALDL